MLIVAKCVRCSQCGRPLRTIFQTTRRKLPILCRHCFGTKHYEGDDSQLLKQYLWSSMRDAA